MEVSQLSSSLTVSLKIGDSSLLVDGSLSLLEEVLILLESWELLQELLWSVLDAEGDSKRSSTNQGGSQVHLPGEWSGQEDNTNAVILHHEELKIQLNKEDDEEPPVVKDSDEDIEFSSGGL